MVCFGSRFERACGLPKTLESGHFDIVSTALDFNTWLVAYSSDKGMAHYYVYDCIGKKTSYLFAMKESLDQYTLAPMHALEIKSRDGLTLPSYLTLPVGTDPQKTDAHEPIAGSLCAWGPPSQDSWGFDNMAQWLANRGYAVLQVNYRGSVGFGKSFINAGNGEWAAKMHDDLIDAVNWAVNEKIADPKKVAIFGGSYGGYATLVGLTFTPDVFACGVDIVGISNLETLLRSVPSYWKPLWKNGLQVGAGLDTEEERAF